MIYMFIECLKIAAWLLVGLTAALIISYLLVKCATTNYKEV